MHKWTAFATEMHVEQQSPQHYHEDIWYPESHGLQYKVKGF